MPRQALAYRSTGGCVLCDRPKRRAPALHIGASVGRGGHNHAPDVIRIQRALNRLLTADGGPSVKLSEDGICGPKTIAAILGFQSRLQFHDGRIDPGGPTLAALEASVASASAPDPAPPNQWFDLITRLARLLPIAQLWAGRARMTLDRAMRFASTPAPGALFTGFGERDFALVDKYFHITALPAPARVPYMAGLSRIYLDMETVFSQSLRLGPNSSGLGIGYFHIDPMAGEEQSHGRYVAFTFAGGWKAVEASGPRQGQPRLSQDDGYATRDDLREDTIFFDTKWFRRYPDQLVVNVMIHETAHFVGPDRHHPDAIGDYSYAGHADFLRLPPTTANRTADIYAYFAAESFLGHPPAR